MCKKRIIWVSLFLSLTLAFNAYAGEIFRTELFSSESFGEVEELTISDDRQTAVFLASKASGEVGIFAMDLNGGDGVARNLSGNLFLSVGYTENSPFRARYLISPDSKTIAFFATEGGPSNTGLYLSSLDGSTNPIHISASQPVGSEVISARFSNDSATIAYLTYLDLLRSNVQLSVVSVDEQPLNLDFQGSNVFTPDMSGNSQSIFESYKFSADSSYLVYGDGEMLNSIALVDGATPNLLRGPAFDIVPNIFTSNRLFEITSSSDHVVFLLEEDTDPGSGVSEQSNLYSIPITGGSAIRLNSQQSQQSFQNNVLEFVLIEGPSKVLFRGRREAVDSFDQVFVTDLDIAESEEVISGLVPIDQEIGRLIAQKSGSKALFTATGGVDGLGSLWAFDSALNSVIRLTMAEESEAWSFTDPGFRVGTPLGASSGVWFGTTGYSGIAPLDDMNFFSVDLDNLTPPLLLDKVLGVDEESIIWSRRPDEYAITYIRNISNRGFQEILFTDILSRERFRVPLPFGETGVLFNLIPSLFTRFEIPTFSGVIDNDTILFPYGDPDTFTMRFYISRRTEMDSDMCFPIAPPDKNPAIICL